MILDFEMHRLQVFLKDPRETGDDGAVLPLRASHCCSFRVKSQFDRQNGWAVATSTLERVYTVSHSITSLSSGLLSLDDINPQLR